MSTQRKVSRRTWLKGLAMFSAAAATSLVVPSTSAEAKANKASVHYRDHPKGMQMCHICRYYVSGGGRRSGGGMCMSGSMMGMMGAGACQVVEGRISPMGWCDLYTSA